MRGLDTDDDMIPHEDLIIQKLHLYSSVRTIAHDKVH